MAFMVPEYTEGLWWEVETKYGGQIVPADLVGVPEEFKEGATVDCEAIVFAELVSDLAEYIEGPPEGVREITLKRGVGARLQAPGYMDCTDWSVFDTEEEAKEHIRDTYEVDPDTGNDLPEGE